VRLTSREKRGEDRAWQGGKTRKGGKEGREERKLEGWAETSILFSSPPSTTRKENRRDLEARRRIELLSES